MTQRAFYLTAAAIALAATQPALADNLTTYSAAQGTPTAVWAMALNSIQSSKMGQQIDGVAIDNYGNVAISGIMTGTMQLPNGPTYTDLGHGDIFIALYDKSQHLIWSKHIGGPGDDNTFDVQMDGQGNVICSGWFADTVNFGGVTLTAKGPEDMFLAKYAASDGHLMWVKQFGGPKSDGGNEVAVQPDGQMAVSAISDGDFTVNGTTYPGGGKRDSFILRLDPNGNVTWVAPFAGPGTVRIRGLEMNSAGEVFAGFEYAGQITLGSTTLHSRGGWDGAVAKLSPTGTGEWIKEVGGKGEDNVRGIATGPNGTVYAAGRFVGPAWIIDRQVPSIGGNGDDFMDQLAPDGTVNWITTIGAKGYGSGAEIRSDSKGVLASALAFGTATVRLGPNQIGTITPPTGLPTSYLAAFNTNGHLRFTYTAAPQGQPYSGGRVRSGAFGDVFDVSPNDEYAIQVDKFRGKLEAAGTTMTTSAPKDSAMIFFDMNGG